MRDSKQNDLGDGQPLIATDGQTWSAALAHVADSPMTNLDGTLSIHHRADGWVELIDSNTSTTLSYDADEWTAFVAGVKAGEFNLEPETSHV